MNRRRFLLGASVAALATAAEATPSGNLMRLRGAVSTLAAPVGGATSGGVRFGAENSAYIFSGDTTQTSGLGAAALGASNYRGVLLPSNHALVPASGDHWAILFFRTGANGAFTARNEYLLGYDGKTAANTPGGGVGFQSCHAPAGSGATGQDRDYANSGLLAVRRQGTSFQLWPTAGAITTAQLAPDTPYMLAVGIQNITGTDFGSLILVNLLDGSYQTAVSTAVTGPRPTAQSMWTLIGALGGGADRFGFSGSASDYAVVNGTFPSPAQAVQIAQGALAISDIPTLIAGATVAYWNTLDITTATGTSLPAQIGAAATIQGNDVVGCAPIRVASRITLRRIGAFFVFPIAQGASDGLAWLEGTGPVGTRIACRLHYADATKSAWAYATCDGSGNYRASIRSPAPKPFYRHVEPFGSPANGITEGDIMDVGIVVATLHQSEGNILYLFTGVMGATPVGDSGGSGHALPQPGSIAGPWASWVDHVDHGGNNTNYQRCHGMAVGPELMYGNGIPGDGAVQIATDLIAASGKSVMLVPAAAKSGTPMDQVCWDGTPVTALAGIAIAGSSPGPYTATLAMTTAYIKAYYGDNGLVLNANWRNQVTPGSVSLNFPGGVVVTDVPDAPPNAHSTGTLTGGNGATGTINYMTGAISVTFGGAQSAAGWTASWVCKQETVDGNSSSKTTNINGYGCKEAVAATLDVCGRFGFTCALRWWVTSNLGEATTVPATMAADIGAKTTRLRNILKAAQDGRVLDAGCADFPLVIAIKGRDTGNASKGVVGNVDVARQADQLCWASLPYVFPGGWYNDTYLDGPTSPHEFYNDFGGRRIARRMAKDIFACVTNDRTVNRGPEFAATPTFAGAVATIPLAYIGAGLSLTVPSGGNPSALDEWYVGTGAAPAAIDNATNAVASIRGDGQAVLITKLGGGNWAGTEVFRYIIGPPGDTSSQAAPASLLYDNRGGFGGFEPGLPAAPKFS